MRNLQRTRSHTPSPAAEPSLRQNRGTWAAHPRLQLISDGVVAGYIHDISARHERRAAPSRLRRQRGDQE
jgi:hypothetical protein